MHQLSPPNGWAISCRARRLAQLETPKSVAKHYHGSMMLPRGPVSFIALLGGAPTGKGERC